MKSIQTPFNVTGGHIAAVTSYDTIVEQKIRDVLVTGKMERPTMPMYGAGLQSLLFENIDELVAADVKTDAALDLLDSVSGIKVLDILIQEDIDDPSTGRVQVAYKIGQSAPQISVFTITTDVLNEESPF
jgi:phage baseplate assembly protein W